MPERKPNNPKYNRIFIKQKYVMRTFIFILLITFSGAALSQSETKIKKIKTLLELTGSGDLGVRVMQSMVNNFKKNYSQVTDKFWDDFMKEVKADDLVNLI